MAITEGDSDRHRHSLEEGYRALIAVWSLTPHGSYVEHIVEHGVHHVAFLLTEQRRNELADEARSSVALALSEACTDDRRMLEMPSVGPREDCKKAN